MSFIRPQTWHLNRGPPFPLPQERENGRAENSQRSTVAAGSRGRSVIFNSLASQKQRTKHNVLKLCSWKREWLDEKLISCTSKMLPAIKLSCLDFLTRAAGAEHEALTYSFDLQLFCTCGNRSASLTGLDVKHACFWRDKSNLWSQYLSLTFQITIASLYSPETLPLLHKHRTETVLYGLVKMTH